MRAFLEVADIFRRHGAAYRIAHDGHAVARIDLPLLNLAPNGRASKSPRVDHGIYVRASRLLGDFRDCSFCLSAHLPHVLARRGILRS